MRIALARALAILAGAFFSMAVVVVLGVAGAAHASDARRDVALAKASLVDARPAPEAARAAAERALADDDEPDAVAEALLLLGQLDEDEGAFARALDRDRACIAKAPSSRWAARAADRMDWLEARAEGDFVPLAELERVRRDPASTNDPRAVAALAAKAETFPPGRVRVEARMLVAQAWLGRLERPGDAEPELRLVEGDPSADPLTARLAERELVDSVIARGDIEAAAREAGAKADRLDPRFVAHVRRLGRRRTLRRAALGELAVFATLATLALIGAARRNALGQVTGALRGLAPVAAGFAAYVAVVGGLLASRYDAGTARPFLWLGIVILPLVLCARVWSAAGRATAPARIARALMSGASVIAAAFILLDAVNPTYLDGFGL